MPFRDLNQMENHDGTNHRVSFGGSFDVYLSLNGDELYRGEVMKGDELYLTLTPKGEADP